MTKGGILVTLPSRTKDPCNDSADRTDAVRTAHLFFICGRLNFTSLPSNIPKHDSENQRDEGGNVTTDLLRQRPLHRYPRRDILQKMTFEDQLIQDQQGARTTSSFISSRNHRVLADNAPGPTFAPAPSGFNPAFSPTPAPSPGPLSPSSESSSSSLGDNSIAIIAIPILGILSCVVCFRCYRNLRRKREQHLLNLRSKQADSVLGDMQMVPSEDPDADLL